MLPRGKMRKQPEYGRPATVIVGLGNTILTDDAVGIHVARALRPLVPQELADIVEAEVAGFRLLDLLIGYQRAILVDALTQPPELRCSPQPGRLWRLQFDQLHLTARIGSSHGAELGPTLETARQLGSDVPDDIIVYGIEVADACTFGETMTEAASAAVQPAAETIAAECFPQGRSCAAPPQQSAGSH